MPNLPSLPFDVWTLAVGGASLIPSIIFLIQIAKSFFPNALPDVWRVSALVLGVLGVVGAFHDQNALPATVGGWIAILIGGLVVGVLASAGYDKTRKDLRPQIYQSMDHGIGLDSTGLQGFDLSVNGASFRLQPSIEEAEEPLYYVLGEDGRHYDLTVRDGQVVALLSDEQPVELGKSDSGTSEFSEG